MDNQYDARSVGADRGRGKRAWTAPQLTRIEASQAELGTNVDVADGGFTTS
jgi:hypothetical protein